MGEVPKDPSVEPSSNPYKSGESSLPQTLQWLSKAKKPMKGDPDQDLEILPGGLIPEINKAGEPKDPDK